MDRHRPELSWDGHLNVTVGSLSLNVVKGRQELEAEKSPAVYQA